MPTVKTLLPQKQAEECLIRVAAYCRVSSDSTEQKDSFSAQVEYYTGLIGGNPCWKLVDIYADEGVTGMSMKKRDDFNRMIADCQRGKIDRIITKSVSRFARNTVECLDMVRKLSQLGISILFEKEQIDTSKMSSEFLLALAGVQAQDESVSISGNMRWSCEKRIRNGDLVGSAAFGYDWSNGTLIVNETEAEIVHKIFDMYLSGVGMHDIARYLNRSHIPCRSKDARWYHTDVLYILQNERYIGDALLQKNYTTEAFPFQKKKNRGEKPMYYVSNSHEPIISREQYELVQNALNRRKREKSDYIRHPLSRLLICPHCLHNYRRVDYDTNPYWKCTFKGSGWTRCEAESVSEKDVYAALIRMVNILWENYDSIIEPTITALEQLHSNANGTRCKIYEIDKAIADANNQIHLLSQLQVQGILDPSDFAAQSNALANKVYRLRGERMRLLRENDHDDNLARIRRTAETIASMDEAMTEFDEDFIRSIVEKIIVKSATEIEIHLFGGLVFTEHLPTAKKRCNLS